MLGGKPPAENPLRRRPGTVRQSEPRRIATTGVEGRSERDDREAAPAPEVKAPPPRPRRASRRPHGRALRAGREGLEIQLSAFRDRKGADVLANRLNSMGFTAYVVPPGPGAPALFRVRVGKFKERREADAVAARLKKEKFNPWILP